MAEDGRSTDRLSLKEIREILNDPTILRQRMKPKTGARKKRIKSYLAATKASRFLENYLCPSVDVRRYSESLRIYRNPLIQLRTRSRLGLDSNGVLKGAVRSLSVLRWDTVNLGNLSTIRRLDSILSRRSIQFFIFVSKTHT